MDDELREKLEDAYFDILSEDYFDDSADDRDEEREVGFEYRDAEIRRIERAQEEDSIVWGYFWKIKYQDDLMRSLKIIAKKFREKLEDARDALWWAENEDKMSKFHADLNDSDFLLVDTGEAYWLEEYIQRSYDILDEPLIWNGEWKAIFKADLEKSLAK